MRRNLLSACLSLMVLVAPVAADDFSSPAWKTEVANGFLPYRKLTYDDFPVCDGVQTEHWMNSVGFLHYSFKSRWTKKDDGTFLATVSEFTVRSGFDQNKSWRRSTVPETKALLLHEQGHLDINELHADDFRKGKLPEGEAESASAALQDLTDKIEALSAKCGEESKQEQEQYDADTNHGSVPAQQQAWTYALRRRLQEKKIVYWDSAGS